MAQHRLSALDARHCMRLIDECAEQWDDPDRWQNHLTTGVESLVGGFGSLFAVNVLQRNLPRTTETWLSDSNDTALQSIYMRFVAAGGLRLMPSARHVVRALRDEGHFVWSESLLTGRSSFHKCTLYQDYLAPAQVDDVLFSTTVADNGEVFGLGLLRTRNDPVFGEREYAVLACLGDAVAGRAGQRLRLRRQAGRHRLTPRQRQTLDCLLSGMTERQAAVELGCSRTTIHEYVGAVYRHFGVHSRAELMSLYVNRRGDTQQAAPDSAPELATRWLHIGLADAESL